MKNNVKCKKNCFKIQRNICLCLLLMVQTLMSSVFAQTSNLLTIQKNNISVRQALLLIEKNSDVVFFYADKDVNLNRKVNINVKKQPVSKVLEELFKNSPNTFKIDGKQVYITKKEKLLEGKPQTDLQLQNPIQPVKNKISGRVVDEKGEPILGATVLIKGTNAATFTSSEGGYVLSLPANAKIVSFSFLGYKPKEITIGSESTSLVVLEDVNISIGEVVVVGYGEQKKATVTGAITSVGAKELVKSPTGSITTAMVGRLPGLVTKQTSGMPGAESPTLLIRGISTLNGASPLVIVDGIERSAGWTPSGESYKGGGISGYEGLNPNDIESISVLKDASATAVYGVRGANGVIIITTKHGTKGKPTVQISGNWGIESPIRLRDNVSSYEWGMYVNEGNANDGVAPAMSNSDLKHYLTGDSPILYPSINYKDYVLNKYAPQQSYNISLNGGTDNVRYLVSGGYLNQDGLVKDLGYGFNPNYLYNRLNLRSNIDIDFTSSLTGSVNIDAREENRGGPVVAGGDTQFFWKLGQAAPFASPGIIDGKFVQANVLSEQSIMQDILSGGCYRSLQTTANTVFSLKQKLDFITSGLSVQGRFSYDSWYTETYFRSKSYAIYTPVLINNVIYYKQSGADGQLGYSLNGDNAGNKRRKNYFEASINYSKTFGDHSITALALYNQSKSFYSESEYQDIPRAYLGFVSRVTYSYLSRYLAEFDFGYNGSENFPKGKRFGKFPALSAGWIVSDENFMKNIDFITHLKLRGSYGLVGNDNIGGDRFLYVSGSYVPIPSGYTYNFGDAASTNPTLGLQEGRMANPNITWEVAKKINVGIETRMFKDQLTFNLDIFKEYRTNILTYMVNIPLMMIPNMQYGSTPFTVGSITPPVNYAKVNNHGYEVEMGWASKIGAVGYNVKGSLTYAHNKRILISETTEPYPWMYGQGQSIGQYYGLICEGYYDSFSQVHDVNSAYSTYGKNELPGDLKYKDINGDGKIDQNDVVPIGHSNIPEETYTINLGLDYKGFDISALFQGAGLVSFIPADEAQIMFDESKSAYSWVVNRWTPGTRDAATYPVLHQMAYNYGSSNDFVTSTYWLKDASYIRLKNLEIGYSLPVKIISLLRISNARIYMNGQNLITWDKLKYFDPESITNRSILYPIMKVYNLGISLTF